MDVLLGADIFPLILKDGHRVGNATEPSAINIIFGWVIMGAVYNMCPHRIYTLHLSIDITLDSNIERFWELEEIPDVAALSSDDILCEFLFSKNVSRAPDGRYYVSLPFRNGNPVL